MSAIEQSPRVYGIRQDWLAPLGIVLALAVSIAVAMSIGEETELPKPVTENFQVITWVDDAETWLKDNYQHITRKISGVILQILETIEFFLWEAPWVFVLGLFALVALAFGGLRLCLFTIVGVCFWGSMDMWFSAMSTLALMATAVALSVLFGTLLGVWCSQSDRVEAIVRPILDTMQTMPAFVYLIPAIFFFGIGGAPAVVATMIYAMPPMVRLTNLGIRQVPATIMEAAESFGSTRMQRLFKVQMPMALPSIMMGVNQTVMMALGLVVLATFIGAGGLGEDVWKAMRQLNIGWSLEGGLSIVFMAIIFDRLSYALAHGRQRPILGPGEFEFRLLPQSWDDRGWAVAIERGINFVWETVAEAGYAIGTGLGTIVALVARPVSKNTANLVHDWTRRHSFLLVSVIVIALLYAFGSVFGDYPKAWQFKLRGPVDEAVDWLTVNPTFIAITKGIRAFTYLYLLNPLVKFLTYLPWWYTTLAFGLIALVSVSWRFALVTVICLVFVGAAGMWIFAMETLATILVCVLVCVVIGVPLGVAAAYNNVFDAIMRPILDTMQTLPTFVYLVPVLMFFGGNIVSAVIATVIYAVPPVIRLTTLGIRQLPHELNEVSTSFGSTTTQSLVKVKLPMALPSIMLGLNQAVMMALAMQVITPLIGGRGLGHQVFDALNIASTGKGLVAGTGIVLLAIILDRLSQAWSQTQRKALGLD